MNESHTQKEKIMEKKIRELIEYLGENPDREGLIDTPHRVLASLKFLTQGYTDSVNDRVRDSIYESDTDEMIIVQNIEFYSLCQHHMLPFIGRCHVAYLPQGKIIGLSKIPRMIEIYARRLQLQEGLTKEIAQTLMDCTQAKGVGVIVEAKHLCMMMRGVQKQNSVMKTSAMLGSFRTDPKTRAEFLSLIQNQSQLI